MTMIAFLIPPEELRACQREIMAHDRKYGPHPAPHLVDEAEKNLERIADCMRQCVVFKVVNVE